MSIMKRCHDYGSYTSDGIIFLSEKFCTILVLNGSDTEVLAYPRPRAGSFHIYCMEQILFDKFYVSNVF